MKKIFLGALVVALLAPLAGCIVYERDDVYYSRRPYYRPYPYRSHYPYRYYGYYGSRFD